MRSIGSRKDAGAFLCQKEKRGSTFFIDIQDHFDLDGTFR